MGINIADNFAYNGKKPMDNRTEYATLSAMKSVADANINEGCICYNKEDGKYYTFKSTNTVDATTGKWREFETGGGGQTYNDFTGATASTAGAHGLVPAPSAGDEGKVLFGNGAWGALPSVDYSVLSNEAFIFSATEKPVGQHTNGKLLYAKTIIANNVVMPNGTNVACGQLPSGYEYSTILNFNIDNSSLPFINSAWVGVFIDASGYIQAKQLFSQSTATCNVRTVVLYTKTTDSPLPAGVKFAGVDENGNVVLKKVYTFGGNTVISGTSWYNTGIDSTTYASIRNAYGLSASGVYFPLMCAGDEGTIKLLACRSGNSVTIRKLVYEYTLAS